jgi:hypothetical protein
MTSKPPPNKTRATPHQLDVNGIRSSLSFCCHIRNAATGGISNPWLYSGWSIHQLHIRLKPSQNGQRLSNPTAAPTATKPHESRHTGAAAVASIDCMDIFIFLKGTP